MQGQAAFVQSFKLRDPFLRNALLLLAAAVPWCSESPYAADPWNLSVLPRQGGQHSSLLRVLDGNITGEWRLCSWVAWAGYLRGGFAGWTVCGAGDTRLLNSTAKMSVLPGCTWAGPFL